MDEDVGMSFGSSNTPQQALDPNRKMLCVCFSSIPHKRHSYTNTAFSATLYLFKIVLVAKEVTSHLQHGILRRYVRTYSTPANCKTRGICVLVWSHSATIHHRIILGFTRTSDSHRTSHECGNISRHCTPPVVVMDPRQSLQHFTRR